MIAPLLAREFMARGQNVICIAIGDTSSENEIINTSKTLQSYENIAASKQRPMPCMYFENTRETPRGVVDQNIVTATILLSAFYSGQNEALDSEDLRNLLNYSNVVEGGMPHRLVRLDFFNGKITPERGMSIPAVITLTKPDIDPDPSIFLRYRKSSFINEDAASAIGEYTKLPLHLAVVNGFFQPVIDRMNTVRGTIKESLDTFIDKPISTSSSNTSGGEVVL